MRDDIQTQLDLLPQSARERLVRAWRAEMLALLSGLLGGQHAPVRDDSEVVERLYRMRSTFLSEDWSRYEEDEILQAQLAVKAIGYVAIVLSSVRNGVLPRADLAFAQAIVDLVGLREGARQGRVERVVKGDAIDAAWTQLAEEARRLSMDP